MAWNEPGKPGDKDPWGQRRRPASGGPDIDRIVRNIQQKFSELFGGAGGGRASGFGFGLIAVVALVIWLLTGFYIVNQGERGVVLRFGALGQITEAGLRWHLPFPIERVEKVNVEKISTIEIGYRSNPRGGKSKVPKEALMLTEDENIIDIEFAVQYWISDAADYVFNVRDQEPTIGQATESAVREVVGRSTLDYVFENRKKVEDNVKELLQRILSSYKVGVQIHTVEMQRAQPPEEVKSAFDDAVKAREDRERLKNEAEAYANDVIPRARGAAARMLQEAEGYKVSVIARADGDARRFSQIANEYLKAPNVTRERLYLETMEQVLSNTTKVFLDQKGGNSLIYLPLDKIMPMGEALAAEPVAPPLTDAEAAAGVGGRGGASRSRADVRKREAQ